MLSVILLTLLAYTLRVLASIPSSTLSLLLAMGRCVPACRFAMTLSAGPARAYPYVRKPMSVSTELSHPSIL